MNRCLYLLALLFLLHPAAYAWQIRDSTPPNGTTMPVLHDTTPPKKKSFHLFGAPVKGPDKGNLLVNPFFLPGYSPDIQFSLAGGAIFSFKTNKKDSLLPRSSVPITLTYSSIKSFIASSGWTTFWMHDKLRINALIQYKASRDAYYGVGYEKAIHTKFPDSTNFWRSFFIAQVRPLWKLRRHLFAGVSLDFNQNVLWKINKHMAQDPYYLQAGQHIVNTGIGGILSYDSRDYPQNAYRGLYSAFIYTFYRKAFGGNTHFGALDFDTRYYLPIGNRKGRTLALNWRSRYDFGQAPFTSMISLGTSNDLRGFRFGQFRDFFLNYFISEYRHKFYKRNGDPSRFGFVVWGGAGAIGGSFGQSLFTRALPDFGVGMRFEIQPRLNLRIDFGYAPSETGNHNGTYFNFLEAF
ncbi:BamA/TamA family outer membrane protein [Deminuibacter soli]|nr:BamA/TamA family outer membrane protein [Deminuibacter soli]